MSKWIVKTKKRMKRLSAIALAIAVWTGNFSGMTVQAETGYEEGEYEVNYDRFDEVISSGEVQEEDAIIISERGYRFGDSEAWTEFTNLYIGGDYEGGTLYRYAPIIIEGVPEGGTISMGAVYFGKMTEDTPEKSCIIVKSDCKISVLAPITLDAYGGSSIEVRNGATCILSGKGDIYVEQYGDGGKNPTPPTISGNGNGNLYTDNYMGHLEIDSETTIFEGFENLSVNLELYPDSGYLRRGEFEISHDGDGPMIENCENVTIGAHCFVWESLAEGTWIEARGDVKIIDNSTSFDISGYKTVKDEPLVKAKNFYYYTDSVGSLDVGQFWEEEQLQNVAIQAEEKISIQGGEVTIKGRWSAPEIELKDNSYIYVYPTNMSTFEGNVQIKNAGNVLFRSKMTDVEQQLPIFAGDAEVEATESLQFEGVYLDEADYFAKDKEHQISYGDGYLYVKTVSDNGCTVERLEGMKRMEPKEVIWADNERKWIFGKNMLLTLTEEENYKGEMDRSLFEVDLEEGEKLSDFVSMAEGVEFLNQGTIQISTKEMESMDQLIDLHPDSTHYVTIYRTWDDIVQCIYTADLAWDQENAKKATWNYISTDTNRVSEVQLYKNGELCQLDGADSVLVSANEFDFTSYMEKEGDGNYVYTVKPVLTEQDGAAVSFVTTSTVYTYQKEIPEGSQTPGGDDGNTGNQNGNTQIPGGTTEKPNGDVDPDDEVEKGDELKYKNALYVVTKVGKNPTVSYKKTLDEKAKTIKIPSTIKVEGVTYKVTEIEDNAFKDNKKITKVTIGDHVKTIGAGAFRGCKKLKTVKLNSALTTIEDEAFYKCTALTSITIPSKVNKIGEKAFYGCKKLKNITIKTKKLTNKNVGKKAFQGIEKKATMKVPSSKLNSYKKLLTAKGVSKSAKIKK